MDTGLLLNSKLIEFIYKFGIKYFVINFENLSFIDLDGIQILKKRYQDILNNNGQLIICNNDNPLYKDEVNDNLFNCLNIKSELDAFRLINI